MSELILVCGIACAATAASIAALLPRAYRAATVAAAVLVPVLAFGCAALAARIAGPPLGAEPDDPAGELDFWMAGLMIYGAAAIVLCLVRLAATARTHARQRQRDRHLIASAAVMHSPTGRTDRR